MEGEKRRLLASLARQIRDRRVLDAMARVPREFFVDEIQHDRVYENTALSIGSGQTISQPSIVALMTEALQLNSTDRVLEVGSGSGYQAAVLAELADRVVSVERIPALAAAARERLTKLGYTNVEVMTADAQTPLGWPSLAPYDAIAVTAAAPHMPGSLLTQLEPGGRLVIPVGGRDEQELLHVQSTPSGGFRSKPLSRCRFVPLIGPGAWPSGPDAPAAPATLEGVSSPPEYTD